MSVFHCNVMKYCCKLLQPSLQCTRRIPRRTYALLDDDGSFHHQQTSVTFVKEENSGIFIGNYSSMGFVVNDNIRILGPSVIFPRSVMHWNVGGVEDINEDSLCLFKMLQPKLDILILGVGDQKALNQLDPSVMKFLRTNKINFEILTTAAALSTFNFLQAEQRFVAGAFIPPLYIPSTEEEMDPKPKYFMNFDEPVHYDERVDYLHVSEEERQRREDEHPLNLYRLMDRPIPKRNAKGQYEETLDGQIRK